MPSEESLPDLPPYSLDVQAMDLGAETKAVGLELIETESREPVQGEEAAAIWAAVFPALVPPFTLLIGYLVLDVVPSALQLFGLVLVLVGFRFTQKS